MTRGAEVKLKSINMWIQMDWNTEITGASIISLIVCFKKRVPSMHSTSIPFTYMLFCVGII